MTDDRTPDPASIASASFTTVRRGLDPNEVRAYLQRLAADVHDLAEREAALRAELDDVKAQPHRTGELDEATVAAWLGEEAARVLTTARDASAQVRAKAQEYADQLRQEVEADTTREREQAQRETANLRDEAAAETSRLREEALAEAEAEIEAARQEGRSMVSEARAVRERMLADLARRRDGARAQLTALRGERDRIVNAIEATRDHLDRLMDDLRAASPEDDRELPPVPYEQDLRAVTTTGEPRLTLVRPLHPVHQDREPEPTEPGAIPPAEPGGGEPAEAQHPADEAAIAAESPDETARSSTVVLGEVETVELTIETVEVETIEATVATVGLEGDDFAAGDLGTGVRSGVTDLLEGPGAPAVGDTDDPLAEDVEAESLDELVTWGGDEASPPSDAAAPRADAAPPSDAAPSPDATSPSDAGSRHDTGTDDTDETDDADATDDTDATDDADDTDETDDADDADRPSVDDLFARIRAARSDAVAPTDVPTGEIPTVDGPAADEASDELVEPLDPDAVLLRARDEAIAPMRAALARQLKRALADEQNEVFDRLRRLPTVEAVDAVLGTETDHAERYRASGEDAVWAAALAGAASTAPDPSVPGTLEGALERHRVLDEVLDEVTLEVAMPLRERLEAALVGSGGETDEATSRLRNAYREWKAQRIDDLAAELVLSAHGRGAYAATPPGQPVRWVLDRSTPGCHDAEPNAAAGPLPCGEAFPTGHRHPPAYAGCRCLLEVTHG